MLNFYFLILTTVYGACVGSFLNVVAYRMPLGRSLVRPGSRCPACDRPIAWYDNIPVLAWIVLRGRCRRCRATISARYPLVEAVTGTLFGGLFYVYYMSGLWPITAKLGVMETWPVLLVHLTLLGCLIAATLIDAEHFIIPLEIPWTATATAAAVLPGAVWLGWFDGPVVLAGGARQLLADVQPMVPVAGAMGLYAAGGGLAGLLVSWWLLRRGVIPRSFDEPMDPGKTVAEEVLTYAHPRREVLKELLFLGPVAAGMIVGCWLGRGMGEPGAGWMVLGGVGLGYLYGVGLVWGVRILGTLAFGKEAMGLGDAHLWGAVGAVLGPADATVAFFVAPFFGLAAVVVSAGLAAVMKGKVRVIPYGPFLAAGALAVMAFRRPMLRFLGIL